MSDLAHLDGPTPRGWRDIRGTRLTKRKCRKAVLAKLDELQAEGPSLKARTELRWLRRRCGLCRKCAKMMAPGAI